MSTRALVHSVNTEIATKFEELGRLTSSSDPKDVMKGTRLLGDAARIVEVAKRQVVRAAAKPLDIGAVEKSLDASEEAATQSISAFIAGIARGAEDAHASAESSQRAKMHDVGAAEEFERREAELSRKLSANPSRKAADDYASLMRYDYANLMRRAPLKGSSVLFQELQVAVQEYKTFAEYAANGSRIASDIYVGLSDLNLAARGFRPVDAAFQGALASVRR